MPHMQLSATASAPTAESAGHASAGRLGSAVRDVLRAYTRAVNDVHPIPDGALARVAQQATVLR